MRILKTFILGVLIVGFISTNLFSIPPQEDDWDRDNYGKFICQIIDPGTGNPVNEVFELIFIDSKDDRFGANDLDRRYTDSKGYLEMELVPYIYYIKLIPHFDTSKFCEFPDPFNVKEEDRIKVTIEKGKITYLKKAAKIGGILKLYTTDLSGHKFNPKEKFDARFDIIEYIDSPSYILGVGSVGDDLNDGVLNVNKLYPGIYSVEILFNGLGYKNIKEESISIEEGKTTEVPIKIDLNDNTGIEGIIKDAKGEVVKGATIHFWTSNKNIKGNFEAFTNGNGYYKLRGMPVGYFHFSYTYITTLKSPITFTGKGLIEVRKNVLSKLDVTFKYTIEELENK